MTTKILGIPLERSKLLDDALVFVVKKLNYLVVFAIDNAPTALDVVFGPRQILRNIALCGSLQAFIMGLSGITQGMTWILQHFSAKGQHILRLSDEMTKANTYAEWLVVAEELDAVRGVDRWRNNDISPLFDNRKLRKRIVDTQDLIKRGNIFDLMFRIRGGLRREEYGILDRDLYTVAAAGTKRIIEEYTDTTRKALDVICDATEEDVPDEAKLAFFNEARHAYGRTALLLSGGAYLGYYHMGVFKTLYQNKLLPRIISGASAGSLMAVVIGCKTDAELTEVFKEGSIQAFRLDYFKFSNKINHPIGQSIQRACPQFLRRIVDPVLSMVFDGKLQNLDIKHLQECCIHNVGRYTFQEAFDRSGRIINITVAPTNDYDPPRLLNYLTSPHVCVWSAACASCAIPGVFDAAELIVKEPTGEYVPEAVSEERRSAATAAASGRKRSNSIAATVSKITYTDGSIENDLPMQQLSELFNVNHFIISQVNPHSALFSTLSLRGQFNDGSFFLRTLISYTQYLKEQVRAWIKDLTFFILSFKRNAPQWALKRGFYSTLTQNYEGTDNDITIMPWAEHVSLINAWMSVLKNPTVDEYNEVMHYSELAVWSNFSKIRAQCKVEMTLDRCVQKLRKKIADSQNSGDVSPVGSSSEIKAKKMDRTPSFYTTRSILNLSGLSVLDPFPVQSKNDGTGSASGGDNDSNSGIDIDAEESDKEEEKSVPISKSTNMASFYYKHSNQKQ